MSKGWSDSSTSATSEAGGCDGASAGCSWAMSLAVAVRNKDDDESKGRRIEFALVYGESNRGTRRRERGFESIDWNLSRRWRLETSSRLCEGLRSTGESLPSAGWLVRAHELRALTASSRPPEAHPKAKNVVSCHRPGQKIGNEAFLPIANHKSSSHPFAHSTSCLRLHSDIRLLCVALLELLRLVRFEAFLFLPLSRKAPVPHRPCGVRPLLTKKSPTSSRRKQ